MWTTESAELRTAVAWKMSENNEGEEQEQGEQEDESVLPLWTNELYNLCSGKEGNK